MSLPAPLLTRKRPDAIHERAEESLRFIRQTMARSAAFTAVPGRGGVVMGGLALLAATLASRQTSPRSWLATWLAAGLLGFTTGVLAIFLKVRSAGPVPEGTARRFGLALLPPLVAGGALTAVLARLEVYAVLPALWLLLYGIAVLSAGLHSVSVVPALGLFLGAVGLVAVLVGPAWGDVLLAVGLGGGQIVAGFIIARRHGG